MNKARSRVDHHGGFTLIELLVVIVILGILSGVVVFAVRGNNDKAAQNARVTDERIVRTALEVYCARNGHYPRAVADPDGEGPQTGKDAMQVLVDEKFLSDRSTYHSLTTGDESDFQPPFEGKCGNTPRHYKLDPGGGSPPPPPEDSSPKAQPVCGFDNGRKWQHDGFCRAAYPGISPTRAINVPDGKILAVGPCTGSNSCQGLPQAAPQPGTFRAEVFDPAGDQATGQGTWAQGGLATAPVGISRRVDSIVLLEGTAAQCGSNCGKVLAHFSGGGSNLVPDVTTRRQWQLYDLDDDDKKWTPIGLEYVDVGGSGIRVRTTLLAGDCGSNCGKVLINRAVILPGGDFENPSFGPAVYELYDPKLGTFTVISGAPDWGGSQSRLSDGTVLIVSSSSFEAKLFNPKTGQFSDAAAPPPIDYLYRERALTLRDNRVLIVSWQDYTSLETGHHGAALYTPDGGAGKWLSIKNCGTCELVGIATDGTVMAFKYEGVSHVRLRSFDQNGNAEWFTIPHWAAYSPGYGVSVTGPSCSPNCGKILLLGTGNPLFYTPPDPAQG